MKMNHYEIEFTDYIRGIYESTVREYSTVEEELELEDRLKWTEIGDYE